MKVKDLKRWLDKQYDDEDPIGFSLWTKDDVLTVAEDMDIELTDDEVEAVLDVATTDMEADIGINWTTLEVAVDVVLDRKEKEA